MEIQLDQGNYEDVITRARAVLRKDERHVDAMVVLASANYALKRNELAKSILGQAIELNPKRADLYNMVGSIELRLGDRPAAMVNYRKAIELRPDYSEARNNLGVLFQEAQDFDASAQEFQTAIRYYPTFREAYLNLGNAKKGLGKFKDAELAFKKAISIDGRYADAYFNLGILYLDSEIPGVETTARLQRSIETFNRYKEVLRGKIPKEDPADKYIEEAKNAIEVEKQKAEMMREAQMGADDDEESEDDADDESGDDE